MAKKITPQDIIDKHPTLTKKYLTELYINQEYSLPDFKRLYGLPYNQTLLLLEYYGINRRGRARTEKTKRQFRETCQIKFGVDNPSKLEEIKHKKSSTFVKNYNVDNIFKSPKFKEVRDRKMLELYGSLSTPNRFGKYQQTWKRLDETEQAKRIEKLQAGRRAWYDALPDDDKQKLIDKKSKYFKYTSPGYCSRIERRVMSILSSMGIGFMTQKWIKQSSFDFLLNDTKIIIEVQGDYWHANPSVYKCDQVIKYPGGCKVASDIWEKDGDKKSLAKSYGYDIIYIWESEIKNRTDDELQTLILEKLLKLKE